MHTLECETLKCIFCWLNKTKCLIHFALLWCKLQRATICLPIIHFLVLMSKPANLPPAGSKVTHVDLLILDQPITKCSHAHLDLAQLSSWRRSTQSPSPCTLACWHAEKWDSTVPPLVLSMHQCLPFTTPGPSCTDSMICLLHYRQPPWHTQHLHIHKPRGIGHTNSGLD